MNNPKLNRSLLWALLVVSALLILTAWGNAYAMFAFALFGIIVAVMFSNFGKKNGIAATAGCIIAAILGFVLAAQ